MDIETARAGLDEIIAAAVNDGTRTIIERDGGEPVVLVRLRDCPGAELDWLEAIWDRSHEIGRSRITPDEIAAEIAASRRERQM